MILSDFRQWEGLKQARYTLHFFNDAYTELHGHIYWEFFIMTEGRIVHVLNDKKSTMQKYDYCLVGPADLHRFEQYGAEHSKHLNICLTDKEFRNLCDFTDQSLYNDIVSRRVNITGKLKQDELDRLCGIANRALMCGEDFTRQKNMLISTLFFEMMEAIVNDLSAEKNSYPDWLNLLLERLNTTETMNMSVDEIIRMSGFSHTHLLRQFKKYTGQTIMEYLNQKKLQYCCNLLQNSNCSTLEISTLLGFSSLSHLNHIFKKKYGITPTEYRKKATPPPVGNS